MIRHATDPVVELRCGTASETNALIPTRCVFQPVLTRKFEIRWVQFDGKDLYRVRPSRVRLTKGTHPVSAVRAASHPTGVCGSAAIAHPSITY